MCLPVCLANRSLPAATGVSLSPPQAINGVNEPGEPVASHFGVDAQKLTAMMTYVVDILFHLISIPGGLLRDEERSLHEEGARRAEEHPSSRRPL